MNKSCITELSELMCTTGGKITIKEHGQTAEITQQNVRNADPNSNRILTHCLTTKNFRMNRKKI
jgi:hypothetical protein